MVLPFAYLLGLLALSTRRDNSLPQKPPLNANPYWPTYTQNSRIFSYPPSHSAAGDIDSAPFQNRGLVANPNAYHNMASDIYGSATHQYRSNHLYPGLDRIIPIPENPYQRIHPLNGPNVHSSMFYAPPARTSQRTQLENFYEKLLPNQFQDPYEETEEGDLWQNEISNPLPGEFPEFPEFESVDTYDHIPTETYEITSSDLRKKNKPNIHSRMSYKKKIQPGELLPEELQFEYQSKAPSKKTETGDIWYKFGEISNPFLAYFPGLISGDTAGNLPIDTDEIDLNHLRKMNRPNTLLRKTNRKNTPRIMRKIQTGEPFSEELPPNKFQDPYELTQPNIGQNDISNPLTGEFPDIISDDPYQDVQMDTYGIEINDLR